MNIPYAKFLVDIVVLVAVASCLNSSIYISSRMIFSLGKRSDAPAFIQRTSAAGVPRAAVIASTLIGMLTTALNFFAPSQVFALLLASSGSIALLVYLVIAFSQLRMRSLLQKQNAEIAFKMWLFPWLTWAVIAFIVFALGVMFVMPQHRLEVTSTLALALVILRVHQSKARSTRAPRRDWENSLTTTARESRKPGAMATTIQDGWILMRPVATQRGKD